jgi:hypothetical protein
MAPVRLRAQRSAIALVPFFCLMAGVNPTYHWLSSFARFSRLAGDRSNPKMRAGPQARQEYAECYFLFRCSCRSAASHGGLLRGQKELLPGYRDCRNAHVAFAQFLGSTFLSAILDNNVIAGFASRAVGFRRRPYLFAMARIAGCASAAAGRIGYAQSAVACAFIQRDRRALPTIAMVRDFLC